MKTIMTVAVLAVSLAAASSANAGNFVSDPVLVDLAQDGHILLPNGIWTGR